MNAEKQALINQGNIYWIHPKDSADSALGRYTHPYVVLQENVLNHSRINTVVVCALTSNPKRANDPGNVLLDIGEANLSKPSVVVVSKVSAVEKNQLGEYIGTLSAARVEQILTGMRFLQLSFFE